MKTYIFENVSAESIFLSRRSPTVINFVSCKINIPIEHVIYAEWMGFFACITSVVLVQLTGTRPGKGFDTWRVLALLHSEFVSD